MLRKVSISVLILFYFLTTSQILCQLTCNTGSTGSVTSGSACNGGTCQTLSLTSLNVASSTYSCLPAGTSCLPGTVKFGNYQSTITTCCSTNNCNTGTATTDSNTLWCNYGQKGTQSLAAQSCPSGGSCASATQTTSGVTTIFYSCVASGCVSGTTSGVTVSCCNTSYCNAASKNLYVADSVLVISLLACFYF